MFDLRPYNRRHAMEGYDPFREMQNFEKEFSKHSTFKSNFVQSLLNSIKYDF